MPTPLDFTDFGTLVPGAPTTTHTRRHKNRFADIKTYAACAMPEVKLGQVYEDLDPRNAGRRIQILQIRGDGKVMVRTLTPRTGKPRTPSRTQRDTTGDVHFIALRRFRVNSRGFRLVRGSTLRSVHAYLLAARLAAACDIAITDTETRACDALIGLLGNASAHEYLDNLIDSDLTSEVYLNGGTGFMLGDALLFIEEADESYASPDGQVANKATARFVAQHC